MTGPISLPGSVKQAATDSHWIKTHVLPVLLQRHLHVSLVLRADLIASATLHVLQGSTQP
jgi:hypothetical protein